MSLYARVAAPRLKCAGCTLLLDLEGGGTPFLEDTLLTERSPRLAHLPSVGDEVDVEGKDLLRLNRRFQDVVGLISGDLGADES